MLPCSTYGMQGTAKLSLPWDGGRKGLQSSRHRRASAPAALDHQTTKRERNHHLQTGILRKTCQVCYLLATAKKETPTDPRLPSQKEAPEGGTPGCV